jgi:hypothetical protein
LVEHFLAKEDVARSSRVTRSNRVIREQGVDFGPLPAHPDCMSNAKKPGVKAREKKTPGTLMAEEVRARANTLTDAERESRMAYAMRAIYGEKSGAAHAHRR